MNRRILRSMVGLILFVVGVFILLGVFLSGELEDQLKGALRTLRVTVINESGEVLFDNRAEMPGLDNHIHRPEVTDAIKNGIGTSERFSETLGETIYYYAIRIHNGNILRLAMARESLSLLLLRFVPIVAFCLLLSALMAFFLAKRLTRQIMAPLNDIESGGELATAYEELSPFFRKIEAQKKEISEQFAALQGRERTIRAITDNMYEGLLLLGEEGRVLLANRSAAALFGVEEMRNKDVIQICREPGFLQSAKRSLAGERAESTLQKNGRIYDVFCNPLAGGGAVILLIDATERHAAEKQRKEFSANVSHELKTPLTAISALGEMIADGTVQAEDTQQFGDKIWAHARRLIDIIDDIIRLAEFDEGDIARSFSRFDLCELARSVAGDLQEQADRKSVAIELTNDKPVVVCANRNMMHELLYNLIDNALKYNRVNGTVRILLSRKGDSCTIVVEDTGIGIPKAHIPRVFERFYRVDGSRSKKTGGTGLGLSIVKHIAEHHGGKVTLKSEENVGTQITCVLTI